MIRRPLASVLAAMLLAGAPGASAQPAVDDLLAPRDEHYRAAIETLRYQRAEAEIGAHIAEERMRETRAKLERARAALAELVRESADIERQLRAHRDVVRAAHGLPPYLGPGEARIIIRPAQP